MLQAKDFSAWIEIENVETPEFGVEVSENEQDVSCWIPSEVGKVWRILSQLLFILNIIVQKFSVHWTNNSLPGLTGGGVQVDGHKCGFEVVASDTRPLTAFMDGIPESNTKTRPFVFTPLELTGSHDAPLTRPAHFPPLHFFQTMTSTWNLHHIHSLA
jgi:hypothetical protein